MSVKVSSKKRTKRMRIVQEIIGLLISFVILIPFLLIVVNSFKTKRMANLLQFNLDGASFGQFLDNYRTVFEEANLLSSLCNSVIVTFISTVLVIICSSMAAFVVVRRGTKMMKRIDSMIIVGLTLPLAMVPTYFMLNKLHLSTGAGAYAGAVLVYVASNFAFAFFLFTGFMKGVPTQIDEAAIIDGATPLRLFFSVIFPLLKPINVTVAISVAMTVWNDFNISLYLLNSSERSTAVLSTYLFMGQKASSWNLLFTDVVLVSLPMIFVYLFLQKHIVAGLTAGAVKG